MGKISQQKQVFAEQLIRESIYSAGLQVLSEYGLEKLTVQRVAVAANLATVRCTTILRIRMPCWCMRGADVRRAAPAST
jgi:hypothetical protein